MNEQIKNLHDRNIITKYREYDVRFLNELLSAGATRTGQVEEDVNGICHPAMRNQPYLLLDGVELSPAFGTARERERKNAVSDSIFSALCADPRTPDSVKSSKEDMMAMLVESYTEYEESCQRQGIDAEPFDVYVSNPFE